MLANLQDKLILKFFRFTFSSLSKSMAHANYQSDQERNTHSGRKDWLCTYYWRCNTRSIDFQFVPLSVLRSQPSFIIIQSSVEQPVASWHMSKFPDMYSLTETALPIGGRYTLSSKALRSWAVTLIILRNLCDFCRHVVNVFRFIDCFVLASIGGTGTPSMSVTSPLQV